MTAVSRVPLGKLQFYWRMTSSPGVPPNSVPDFVDFEFSFLEELQLIIQTRNAQTLQYLETIYRENYNVGYLQEGHALAESYGNDFIGCIERAVATFHPGARRISEIGAGGCYILKQLKQRGYTVAAIDPSPVAMEKGRECGVEVIPEFYPASRAIPGSDAVIHYDVLEHVVDPVAFLRHHLGDLNPGGLIVVAVPDCTPYIERGDISMILHEHLNYYDAESLANVVSAAGFEVLDLRRGGYGGVLYCVARAADRPSWRKRSGTKKFEEWADRVTQLRARVDAFVSEGTAPGRSLGCYVPLRAAPYLSLHGMKDGFRFFDDDPGMHGRYFDGLPAPVENMSDLAAAPVSHLLILSFAFGDRIRQKICARLPGQQMAICCLSDFDRAPIALTIVIPGFNEAANIEAVVCETTRELDASPWAGRYELVLVDDGSSDGTGAIMNQIAAGNSCVVVLHHEVNRGFGAALRTGFASSRGAYVTLLTADGEFGADQVIKLLGEMKDADLIVSRRERNASTAQRELLSSGAILLSRLLLGMSPDGVTGIYVVRGDLLRRMPLFSDTGLANLEVVMRCREQGCRIASSVVQVRPRLSGESKVTNLSTTLQTIWEMVKLRLAGRHQRPVKAA